MSTSFSSFNNSLSRLFGKCAGLLESKGHDYSTNENTFVNFETSAMVAGTTREQSCMVLIGTKCSRLRELLVKDKEPLHESIEDTIVDLACYVALLYGMVDAKRVAPPNYDPDSVKINAQDILDYDMRHTRPPRG